MLLPETATDPLRSSPRWLGRTALTILLLAVLLLAGAVGAWASHTFIDVPDGNPFHDDIDWLADAGVTTGFDDGTFRPDEGVTRGQMAAFEHRGAPKITFFDDALSATGIVPTTDYALVDTLGMVTKDNEGTALRVTVATQVRTVDLGGIGACQWQLRVAGDNTAGGQAGAAGDTVLVVNADTAYVLAHMEAWFFDVPAGTHPVTLHLRGNAENCLADVGGFLDRTTVEELVVRD